MGEYQEWAVDFKCKKEQLKELLDLCEDIGIDVNEENDVTELRSEAPALKGMLEVSINDADTASYGFYDELVKLKKILKGKGAIDVSVRHTWPPELAEVEDLRSE